MAARPGHQEPPGPGRETRPLAGEQFMRYPPSLLLPSSSPSLHKLHKVKVDKGS